MVFEIMNNLITYRIYHIQQKFPYFGYKKKGSESGSLRPNNYESGRIRIRILNTAKKEKNTRFKVQKIIDPIDGSHLSLEVLDQYLYSNL